MKLLEKQEISHQKRIEIDPRVYHNRGLIPGPAEDAAAFFKRITLTKQEIKHPIDSFFLTPDWVPISTPQKKLPFWEAATTWIEEKEDQTRTCFIQLNTSWLTRLYSPQEILSHELVHAVRLMYDEPRFEEILAFQTSSNALRRFFGPLFSRPKETTFFLITLALSWVGYSAGLFLDNEVLSCYFLLLPLLGLTVCLSRLLRSQYLFKKTQKIITNMLDSSHSSLPALLYLTDAEIKQFSILSSKEITAYIENQKLSSLRWQQWAAIYTFKN